MSGRVYLHKSYSLVFLFPSLFTLTNPITFTNKVDDDFNILGVIAQCMALRHFLIYDVTHTCSNSNAQAKAQAPRVKGIRIYEIDKAIN